MRSGVVITNVRDAAAVILKVLESARREIVFVTSPALLSIAGTFDTIAIAKRFIDNGGTLRGITTISRANVEEIRMLMDVGLNLRHSDEAHELSLFVADKQNSMSGLNTEVDDYALDTPVSGFWSEDPAFAAFLLAIFESAWSRAIPAEERIQELMKQGC